MKTLTSAMLRDLRYQFASIMLPTAEDFNPLPTAAACLRDPWLSQVLMAPDQAAVLHAAKSYIIQECDNSGNGTSSSSALPLPPDGDQPATSCVSSRLRFFVFQDEGPRACCFISCAQSTCGGNTDGKVPDSDRGFWDCRCCWCSRLLCSYRQSTYSTISPLAEDLLAAPASQAFVERIFRSVGCGQLPDVTGWTSRCKCEAF